VAETDAVIQAAHAKHLFLMEAMWTRCLPAFVKIRELIRAGALGEVRMVTADFGFRTSVNAEGRLFNKVYGGGSLLDVGVYPVSLASMLLGTPTTIKTLAHLGQTGVDEEAAMIFGYSAGTEGTIKIADWWRARQFTLIARGKTEVIELPFEGNGYNYEAVEVMRCLRAGQLESETMPLDESRAIMATMDAIRAQWGLKYPSEA
jgi:predicted dehydrogenase